METLFVFAVITGIIFIGFFSDLIFKKTNIPDVLILIVIGYLISSVLGWVPKQGFGDADKLFTTFALLFILFQGSLNIEFKPLFQSLQSTLVLTTLSFIFTVSIITGISYFIFHDLLLAILAGTILGGTSSAVVIPLISNLAIKDKFGIVLTIESAVSDVFAIVGAITVIQIIQTGNLVPLEVFKSIITSFSLSLVAGIVFGIIWIMLLSRFDILTKSYIVTIGFVTGVYTLVESPLINASGAIAVLVFGIILGNSKGILNLISQVKRKKRNEEENQRGVLSTPAKNFYSEITFFIKTFFFVYLGVLINFDNWQIILFAFLTVLGIFLLREIAVKIVFFKNKIDVLDRSYLNILIPKGLAATVLAGVALQSGVLSEISREFVNFILTVVIISIIFTSILVFITNKNWFKGFLLFLYKKENEVLDKKE